ncbi:hypothetical protein F2Q69_00047474 [Brassica cretica]|uniref:Uncharacterized protein n=1 Tax=Brassica cretica TaxID=69181 RepID=A0A8S9PSF5_BRACR|nr:hypothetical protein F2Q69_00047474 [Brassica cretica]
MDSKSAIKSKFQVKTPFQRFKTGLVNVSRKVNPLVKAQSVDSPGRLGRVGESPVATAEERWLTGKVTGDGGGGGAAASSRRWTDSGSGELAAETAVRAFHALAKGNPPEVREGSYGLRLRRGWCLWLRLNERNTMVVLDARISQRVVTACGGSGDDLRTLYSSTFPFLLTLSSLL